MKINLEALYPFLQFFRARNVVKGSQPIVLEEDIEAFEIFKSVKETNELKAIADACDSAVFDNILDLIKIKMVMRKDNMEGYPDKLRNILKSIKKIVDKK